MVGRFLQAQEVNSRLNQTFRRLKKNRVRAFIYPLHLQADGATILTPDTFAGLQSLLLIQKDLPEDSPWPQWRHSLYDVLFLVKRQMEHIVQSQVEPPSLMAFAEQGDEMDDTTDADGKA